ncbi:hypothetical protein MA16_Dca006353 [Dendrobium catenatum]|uniref:Uncharacterized protein n=1 Tax=Dendrobium catenatum TaxID=906689 RepID=A0A2I0W9M1_9ASPA|nr:hypothetical protein MA16_Dca006353 [Dendrobium catenatum]
MIGLHINVSITNQGMKENKGNSLCLESDNIEGDVNQVIEENFESECEINSKYNQMEEEDRNEDLEEGEVGSHEILSPKIILKDSTTSMLPPNDKANTFEEGNTSYAKKKGKNKKSNMCISPKVTRVSNQFYNG